MATDGKNKTQKVSDILGQAKEIAEMGKAVAPPGVRGPIQTGEDAIEIAEVGISLSDRIWKIFKKKKK